MRRPGPLFANGLRVIFPLLVACVVSVAVAGGSAASAAARDLADTRLKTADGVLVQTTLVTATTAGAPCGGEPDAPAAPGAVVPVCRDRAQHAEHPALVARPGLHPHRFRPIRAPPHVPD